MENKRKHLEFIQNIITRINTNSFMIKGWSVTLVGALFGLAADKANIKFAIIAYLPVILFWGLDGFFLSQEKQYRKLYEKVASTPEDQIDFSLNASEFNAGALTWYRCVKSKTLLPFHGTLFLVVCITMFAIPFVAKLQN
jgi:hypothetical protein